MTTERKGTLKFLLVLWRGFELVCSGLAATLLFHTLLFCLRGERAAISGMFVALSGHPDFIPIAKARRSQLEFLLGGKRSIGERRDKALDAVDVPPVVDAVLADVARAFVVGAHGDVQQRCIARDRTKRA